MICYGGHGCPCRRARRVWRWHGREKSLWRPGTITETLERYLATNGTINHARTQDRALQLAFSPMPTAPSRPATPGRGGVWEPLPSIIYGYAVHPLSPSHRDTRISSRPRLSNVTQASTASSFIHRDVVALEVGDEVYAFEKYTPRGKETETIWYRGWVSHLYSKYSGLTHHLAMLYAPLGVPLCLGMCRLTRRHPGDQGSRNLSRFSSAYSLVHTSSFGRNCLTLREVLPTSRQPSRTTHDSLSRTVPSPRPLVLGRLRKTTVNHSGLALPPNRQIHPEQVFPSTPRAFAPYRRRDHKI